MERLHPLAEDKRERYNTSMNERVVGVAARKVLYIVHNHPSVRPGGAEMYALELYKGMRDANEFEPLLLARTGKPLTRGGQSHAGTPFAMINSDPNQQFIYIDNAEVDWVNMTLPNKEIYTRFMVEFLEIHQPDVVHFQHTNGLGYDLIRAAKKTLPYAPILYTLHEYIPICLNNGQMVRTFDRSLCYEASPRRCHECFPHLSPQAFFLRRRFTQSHFDLVDLFLAPSHFLLERYVEWGIARDKIVYEDYGRQSVHPIQETASARPRNRFAFFGQLSPFKGADVLLKAMTYLEQTVLAGDQDGPAPHLWIYGASLDMQPAEFRDEFQRLLARTTAHVTFAGPYQHDELPRLMANIDWVVVPSIWWENAPLVIQEAFAYRRPVICSDIGGMAEKVEHGRNGLHFRVGDAVNLAETLRYAASEQGLWERLRDNIPSVYPIEASVSRLTRLYSDLIVKKQNSQLAMSQPLAD